uniref:RING-type domain-containing protein n=1 Tax=viral metagenome TaxID=1070528 RepID=A0A6C0AZQ1_9ZZZZ
MNCQAITKTGNTCKRKAEDFCCFHKQVFCNNCKKLNLSKNSIILECGHNFCKTCLANDIYKNQWFEGFSTEHPLLCPDCDSELSDSNWQDIMDHLVFLKKVQRKIIYTYYLTREWSDLLFGVIEIGKEYTWSDLDQIDKFNEEELILLLKDEPSKVYFEKYGTNWMAKWPKRKYTIELDYNSIKSANRISQQELAEYIFHPDRVRRFGIEYLDT